MEIKDALVHKLNKKITKYQFIMKKSFDLFIQEIDN